MRLKNFCYSIMSRLTSGKLVHSGKVRIYGYPLIVNRGTITFGDNVKLRSGKMANITGLARLLSFSIQRGGQLIIGENTGISNSTIYCTSKITIGNRVLIGTDSKIYDNDFHSLDYRDRKAVPEIKPASKDVEIGDDVFIGTGCIILKGSEIGNCSVIGAGSVVSGVIPENQIWAGNPARYIKDISQ